MPVAEHGEMGSRDDLIGRLLDVLELQARALSRESLEREDILHLPNGVLRRLNDDPTALREFYDQAIGTYRPPTPKRPGHRPNEKDMREWAAFRARYQGLERKIRVDYQLGAAGKLDREMMSTNGGEPAKTMLSHMLWHGLTAEQWPPSTWPNEPPEQAV
jgi:hypothetical protein